MNALETTFDGVEVTTLAERWGVPQLLAYETVGSTMDAAHAAARTGAPDGTMIVADAQTAGRGRSGHVWVSPPGGAWCSLVVRPSPSAPIDPITLGVLTLRVGLACADALEALVGAPTIGLKWPNDLWWGEAKLGGVLTEAHWDGPQLGWLVVGIGINLARPEGVQGAIRPAAALPGGASRLAVCAAMARAVRAAARRRGPLSREEQGAFAARDVLKGRLLAAPVVGEAAGITADGALVVLGPGRQPHYVRAGEVRFPSVGAVGETPAV